MAVNQAAVPDELSPTPDTTSDTTPDTDVPAAAVRSGILRHEWTIAAVTALGVAVAWVWLLPPVLLWVLSAGATPIDVADPTDTIIGDSGDPTGQAWLLAWNGHALLHEPGRLWDTNAFYPDKWGLALSDSLLGYLPAGWIGSGVGAALLRYNVLFVLTFALASFGAYALARQLGANRIGGALAGAAFAYAPWHYGHDGHLNILSSGGIVLSLAMLARGHGYKLRGGFDAQRQRPGWAVAGWLTAAWQVTLGFGIGLPFVYVLLGVCLSAAVGWLLSGRPRIASRLLLADLGGGLVFVAVSGYMARAYLAARDLYPEAKRSLEYVALYSPPPRGLLTAPRTSLPWGTWHDGARAALDPASTEKAILCGFALYGLALAGLVVSSWTVRQRLMLAGGTIVGMMLALGTNAPFYTLLWAYLPGFDGSRTPGRLILWSNLLLALLAAGLVTELSARVRAMSLPAVARKAVLVIALPPALLVLAEGLPTMDHVPLDPEPAAVAMAPGPKLILPSDDVSDMNYQFWSINGFAPLVNGSASLVTPVHDEIREVTTSFPSADSVQLLRKLGVKSVVVVRSRAVGSPYEGALTAPVDGLGISRRDIDEDILFTID